MVILEFYCSFMGMVLRVASYKITPSFSYVSQLYYIVLYSKFATKYYVIRQFYPISDNDE